jgi:hypothetical protein
MVFVDKFYLKIELDARYHAAALKRPNVEIGMSYLPAKPVYRLYNWLPGEYQGVHSSYH